LITPVIGGMKLQALQPDDVERMMDRLKDDGRAARTVTYARSILAIALSSKIAKKIVPRNVASRESMGMTKKKKTDPDIKVLNAGEVTKILAKIVNPTDRLLIRTIASFGLRIGESLGLRWSDIDFDARSMHITQAAQRQPSGSGKGVTLVDVKTKNSRRTLLIPDRLLAELKAHRVTLLEHRMKTGDRWADNDLVFPSSVGTPQDSRNVLRVLHRAQKAAKVARSSLHRLRHSAATYMLSQ